MEISGYADYMLVPEQAMVPFDGLEFAEAALADANYADGKNAPLPFGIQGQEFWNAHHKSPSPYAFGAV